MVVQAINNDIYRLYMIAHTLISCFWAMMNDQYGIYSKHTYIIIC